MCYTCMFKRVCHLKWVFCVRVRVYMCVFEEGVRECMFTLNIHIKAYILERKNVAPLYDCVIYVYEYLV